MNKRHIIFISLIVFGLLIAIISITYALNTTIIWQSLKKFTYLV